MKTDDFDYVLPERLIAQRPLDNRDESRLMVVSRATGTIEHRRFRDLVDLLQPGDLLCCNDSRVIPARLFGRKAGTGGQVELLLVRRVEGNLWESLARPGRLRIGTVLEFDVSTSTGGATGPVTAMVRDRMDDGTRLIEFDRPASEFLNGAGVVPLPPYVHEHLSDPERYQTVYSREEGSVAAPTAGLHFTPDLMKSLRAAGVEFAFTTLHVGPGTFLPVRTDDVESHRLHQEWYQIKPETAEALNRARAEGRRIIAVGTTSVRVLETVAGRAGSGAEFSPSSGWTDIFIYPGYKFRAVGAMITNFHLPRSTLLMLISALAGKDLIDRAYHEAVECEYRFYSFGDAMLIV